jgi:hypothetical protein
MIHSTMSCVAPILSFILSPNPGRDTQGFSLLVLSTLFLGVFEEAYQSFLLFHSIIFFYAYSINILTNHPSQAIFQQSRRFRRRLPHYWLYLRSQQRPSFGQWKRSYIKQRDSCSYCPPSLF